MYCLDFDKRVSDFIKYDEFFLKILKYIKQVFYNLYENEDMINVVINKFDKYKLFMCDDYFGFIVLFFQFCEGLF